MGGLTAAQSPILLVTITIKRLKMKGYDILILLRVQLGGRNDVV